jgi:hypothetical protein
MQKVHGSMRGKHSEERMFEKPKDCRLTCDCRRPEIVRNRFIETRKNPCYACPYRLVIRDECAALYCFTTEDIDHAKGWGIKL